MVSVCMRVEVSSNRDEELVYIIFIIGTNHYQKLKEIGTIPSGREDV